MIQSQARQAYSELVRVRVHGALFPTMTETVHTSQNYPKRPQARNR